MTDKHLHYVYLYFRPNGVPCYVGKGYGARWRDHLKKKNSNRHLSFILDQATAAGKELPVVIISEGLTDAGACALEKIMIAAIGREKHGGPLVNLTDGGDGQAGWEPSEETRRKIGEKSKGRIPGAEARAKMSAAHRGRETSAETREKLRIAHTGRQWSAEHLANMRAANAIKSPEHCQRISDAKRGKSTGSQSAETRAKRSASMTGLVRGPQTAEHRAKINARIIGGRRSEETKAKMRAAWTLRKQAVSNMERA
jgi:hypothetical protein